MDGVRKKICTIALRKESKFRPPGVAKSSELTIKIERIKRMIGRTGIQLSLLCLSDCLHRDWRKETQNCRL
jgi:hypothetical protein